MSARAGVLSALRGRVAAIETSEHRSAGVLPFGDARVDLRLSGGGLQLGRWHELKGDGLEAETAAATAGFAARLAAGIAQAFAGEVVWAARRDDLYGPGAASFGLDPDRLLLIGLRTDEEVLAAVEDALSADGVAAVVGEVETLDLTAGRRLQLACERRGATGLIVRRRMAVDVKQRSVGDASAAATRWRIAPEPSAPELPRAAGLGLPRWRARLERQRGGRAGAWIFEACDGTNSVRVAAELGDHDLEAAPYIRLAAG